MVNPIPGSTLGSRFKQKGRLWSLGYHTGQDFVAPLGTPIRSMRSGTVVQANRYDKSFGYKVVVNYKFYDHDYDVWYCHMPKDGATVKTGDKVITGQQIGVVGVTGNTTGPHCHVEVRSGDKTWKAANFRDPLRADLYGYVPLVIPPRNPLKHTWAPIDIATINAACYNDHGRRTYEKRFPLIASRVLARMPDAILFQEMGNLPRLKGQDERALGMMKRLLAPQYRWDTGSDGRYVVTLKSDDLVYSEVYNLPKDTLYGNDDKQGAIKVVRNNGTGRPVLYGSLHTENEDKSGKSQVKQFLAFQKRCYVIAKKYGVHIANVFIGGDMNSENLVRRAAEKSNLASALDVAPDKTTVKGELNSINHWKPPVNGPKSDYLFVRHSDTTQTPVYSATQINDPMYTDHGMFFFETSLLVKSAA